MANDNNVYTYDVNFSVGECPTLQTTAPDFILPNGTPAGAISCCPPVGPDGRWLCPGTLGAFVISWPARKNNRNIKYIFQVIGITFDDMSLSNVTLPRAASTSNCLCNSWHRFSITAFCDVLPTSGRQQMCGRRPADAQSIRSFVSLCFFAQGLGSV